MAVLPAFPHLVFSRASGGGVLGGGPPVQVVLPLSVLGGALVVLAVLGGGALAIHARVMARSPLSQTLRLDEA